MADYTSKVPFYTFPVDSLATQEEALAQNPLMQRLLASRQTYTNDPHRPIYHYINPEANLNDPNASGRAIGICSIRPIHPKIPASTGATPSAPTSSTGATYPIASTPAPSTAVSQGPH